MARPEFSRSGAADGTRELIVHPGSVVILAMTDDNQVVLIDNHRVSVGEYLVELPAGTLHDKEDPLLCAKRELLEETGYQAAQWTKLFSFCACPGISDEQMFVFAAKNLTRFEQKLDDDEQITVRLQPFAQTLDDVARGRIRDGKTIVSLLYWARFGAVW